LHYHGAMSLANLQKLAGLLGAKVLAGGDIAGACAKFAAKKNREHARAFAAVPFAERIVFVPQCLRATGRCKAQERGAEYICKLCGACKVAAVAKRAEELGYMGLKILKGGSAVARHVEKLKPRAVLGLACHYEGALGIFECERLGVAVQFVSLARDGCADTDVELDKVLEVMEMSEPADRKPKKFSAGEGAVQAGGRKPMA
jgi:hypothetical protein